MFTMIYDPIGGIAVPDGDCEEFMRSYVGCQANTQHAYSTENVFTACRVLIAEGVLSHKHVQFRFKGQIIPLNADGRFLARPEGFCDFFDGWLMRLLDPKRPTIDKEK